MRIVLPTREDPFAGIKYLRDEIAQVVNKNDVETSEPGTPTLTVVDADAAPQTTDSVRESVVSIIRDRIRRGSARVLSLGLALAGGLFATAVWVGEAVLEVGIVDAAVVYVFNHGLGIQAPYLLGEIWINMIVPAATFLVAHLPFSLTTIGITNPVTFVAIAIAALAVFTILALRGHQVADFLLGFYQLVFRTIEFGIEIVRNIVGGTLFLLGAVVAAVNAGTAWFLFVTKWFIGRIGLLHDHSLSAAIAAADGRTPVRPLDEVIEQSQGRHPSSKKKAPAKKTSKGKRPHPARRPKLSPVTA